MYVPVGEHASVLYLVASDLQIVPVDSVDRSRSIVGSVDGLAGTVDRRGHIGYEAGLTADVLQILYLERFHVIGA